MKIFSFLLFNLLSLGAFAQTYLHFSGVVYDVYNQPMSALVAIGNSDTATSGNLFGLHIFTNGAFHDSVALPSGTTQGYATITVHACDTAFSADYPYGPGNYHINVDSVLTPCNDSSVCQADFGFGHDTTILDTVVQYYFQSTSSGLALNYNWDFGDGGTSTSLATPHRYYDSGIYYVTLYISNGFCSDSITKPVHVFPRCYSYFTFATPNNDREVHFTPAHTGYTVYDWDFGDGNGSSQNTPTHTYAAGGSYDVELNVIDSGKMCTGKYLVNISLCDSGGLMMPRYIYGHVEGNTLDSSEPMIIYLIRYDSSAGTLTLADSLIPGQFDNNGFFFGLNCPGEYLVKAALLPTATHYQDYLPTYHDSFLYYHQATMVNNSSGPQFVKIYMIQGTNPGGPGFIGGYVNQGANKNGNALDGISVLLLTDADVPVKSAITANGGRYEFSNLALGKYKIRVEIPGKPSSVILVELTQTKQSSEDNDFEVNSKDITITSRGPMIIARDVKVYPNPTSGKLFVELDDSKEYLLLIRDINGKIVLSQKLVHSGLTAEVNISVLETGLYFISLSNDKEELKGRFSVIH